MYASASSLGPCALERARVYAAQMVRDEGLYRDLKPDEVTGISRSVQLELDRAQVKAQACGGRRVDAVVDCMSRVELASLAGAQLLASCTLQL